MGDKTRVDNGQEKDTKDTKIISMRCGTIPTVYRPNGYMHLPRDNHFLRFLFSFPSYSFCRFSSCRKKTHHVLDFMYSMMMKTNDGSGSVGRLRDGGRSGAPGPAPETSLIDQKRTWYTIPVRQGI